MTSLWAFLQLSRPHFLIGGALMYAVGASLAGDLDIGTYLLGQAMVSAAQLTAHFVNEYADVEVDRHIANRTMFSGGSGVLTQGRLSAGVALRAATVTSTVAIALIVAVGGISSGAAFIGVAALAVSWGYSMPPVRLLNTGWGEVATSIVVGALVPATGALVNGGGISVDLAWVAAVFTLLNFATVLAFELPDLESDRTAGKTVLAVRIGGRRAKRALAAIYGAAAIVGVAATVSGSVDLTSSLVAGSVPAGLTIIAANRDRYALLTTAAVASVAVTAIAYLAS
ncbi:MAG: prenyltransferase [Acidimicrobiia bacterium]|nr:prenyltransferase [Acidimicrobiia bacterium]